ncbi:hypothetical protein [Rhizobium sp. SSA_523]|uniref:hypothetical protein n=1 Tax=Rhizobium sp. SSA_523 TaxID=2952477 RepID=UPI0020903AC5|nr:hypothetical protein [Rhizobium sp. SSA_523]MCO5733047.1 hypothetical protein [Rhizobium sp. SSA_523]WKC23927.1 hypothetical protein QTJ18_24680 [Rhizobium sp. SSA_523]
MVSSERRDGRSTEERPTERQRPAGSLWKTLVLLAAALGGASAPLFMPSQMARSYRVETDLLLRDADGRQADAFLADAKRSLQTSTFLDAAIRHMKTEAPGLAEAQTQSVFGFLSDLVTRRDMRLSAMEDDERRALAGAISLRRDDAAAGDAAHDEGDPVGRLVRMAIVAETKDPQRAVLAANAVADLLAVSGGRGGEALRAGVHTARKQLEEAQGAYEAIEISPADMEAYRIWTADRQALLAEKAAVESRLSDAKARLTQVAGLNVDDILAQNLPEILPKTLAEAGMDSGLEDARRRHQDALLKVQQLSEALGPRHPKLVAAKAAEEDARAAIAKVVAGLAAGLKQNVEGLKQQQGEIETRLAGLQALPQAETAGLKMAREAEVDAARRAYLQALDRSRANADSAAQSVTRLPPARLADVESSGLPAWLSSLMGALALSCLAGAVLPSRGRQPAAQHEKVWARRTEPGTEALMAAIAPARPPAGGPPMVSAAQRPAGSLPAEGPAPSAPIKALEHGVPRAPAHHAAERVPVAPVAPIVPMTMPSFDDYYRIAQEVAKEVAQEVAEKVAKEISHKTFHEIPHEAGREGAAQRSGSAPQGAGLLFKRLAANDDGQRQAVQQHRLETMLLAHRAAPSGDRPLPALLAEILDRHPIGTTEQAETAPLSDHEELMRLKQGIAILRRQMEERITEDRSGEDHGHALLAAMPRRTASRG